MRCFHCHLNFLQNIQSLSFTSNFALRGCFGETKSDAVVCCDHSGPDRLMVFRQTEEYSQSHCDV